MLLRKPHHGQDPVDLLLALFLRAVQLMDIQPLADDVPDLLSGIQGRHGILEDHLHLRAQQLEGVPVQFSGDVRALEGDLPVRGVIQTDDPAADGGLAGTGLSHQPVGLAGIDLEADVVHRFHREGGADLKVLLHMLDFQDRVLIIMCRHPLSPPSAFSGSAS